MDDVLARSFKPLRLGHHIHHNKGIDLPPA
jgi:hypothetical protein